SAPAVVVYAKQLPPPATGRVYQVWLEGGGVVRNVGTFAPDANQRAWALLGPQSALPNPETVFITEEPLPSSPQPSGPEVLRARFP
ncbi:MAG: anti-sigma factor, partial [Chloroflexales bacterium]|nr:anti-sigma factor [Chloroflexales bacterium]